MALAMLGLLGTQHLGIVTVSVQTYLKMLRFLELFAMCYQCDYVLCVCARA